MVMIVGGCPIPYKQKGGIVRAGEMSGGICPRGKCPTLDSKQLKE